MEITITNEQQVRVTLQPVTATGKPSKIDGRPVWAVDSGTAQVVPSDDGLSALIVSGDEAGDSVIDVSADVNLGAEVETINEKLNVRVTHANASSLGISVSTPEAKP